jgi:membrane-bound serine protease (ClpP class)
MRERNGLRATDRPRRPVGPVGALGLFALLAGLLLGLLGPLGAAALAQEPPRPGTVLVTTLSEPITPVIADHLRDGIRRAERDGHQAYLVELDTPGGLESSMRSIVQSILGSTVPVVVYAAPPGARVASAGAVIATAAHVAAMAPGTTIGAATPVPIDGGEVLDKVVEDAAAYVEELALLRDRDVEFAVAMVREGRALPAERAVTMGAVDLLASDRTDLFGQLEGTSVTLVEDRSVTLGPVTEFEDHDLTWTRRILQWLADPNVAFILLSVGTLGLIYELASPGVGVGGTLGVTAIVLALFSLAVLPVNAVGVVFLLLALALFVAELFAPGVGIAAAGGAVMLVLAALFLFDAEAPGVALSLYTVVPVALVVFVAVLLAGRLAWRAREAPPLAAAELVGREGRVGGSGEQAQVFVNGAWWSARAVEGRLTDGDVVRVVARDGLVLMVEPRAASEASPDATTERSRE